MFNIGLIDTSESIDSPPKGLHICNLSSLLTLLGLKKANCRIGLLFKKNRGLLSILVGLKCKKKSYLNSNMVSAIFLVKMTLSI